LNFVSPLAGDSDDVGKTDRRRQRLGGLLRRGPPGSACGQQHQDERESTSFNRSHDITASHVRLG
jgi:hypothetical protein